MDKAVNHEHNNPVFYKRDLVFTKLVVDKWVKQYEIIFLQMLLQTFPLFLIF